MTAGSRLHVPALLRPWAERLAAELLRPEPGSTCVDMPCGDGVLAAALGRRGARVAAFDTDVGAVAACAEMATALGLASVEAVVLAHPADAPRGVAAACGSLFALTRRADPAAWLQAGAAALVPGGRLAAAVWGAPGSVPPVDHVLAALAAVTGGRPPTLDAALSLGRPGALEAVAAAAGLPGASVERLRDIARFDLVEHLLAVVSSAFALEAHLEALDEAALAALLEALSQRLLPYAAWDGTLLVPVEAVVLSYAATEVV